MNAETVEKALRKQIGIIGEAVTRVNAGVIVNINDVEEQVVHICRDISALPVSEAQKLEPVMAEMIGRLEDLAAALSDFQKRNDGDGAD